MAPVCNESIKAVYFAIKSPMENNVVSGFQLGIVVCSLGFIELLGMALNFMVLVVLCQDRKNRGCALLLLQVMTAFDNFYLATNFAGTWLPAFLQYVTYGARDCPQSDYTKFRLQEDVYFKTILNCARDCVNWMMIMVAEYSSFPLCCPSHASKRLYNKLFIIIDMAVIMVVVFALNIFKFVCGPSPFPWSPQQCHLPGDGVYLTIDKATILIPVCGVLIMYLLLIIQMYVSKGTTTDPRGTQVLVQINRAFAIMSLYLACETPNFFHHLLRWEVIKKLMGGLPTRYVISYLALFTKHVNSSCKFFVYCYVGTEFKVILKRLICEDYGDDDSIDQQEMEPVLQCDQDERDHDNFDDTLSKRCLLNEDEAPCAVAHQVTVV